jgi:hypothetical protein
MPATPPEVSEDTGTGKRRVKIKAESEVTAPGDNGRAGSAAKPSASAKSAARGGRNSAGRRAANTEKAPPGLLARLGAAAETPPVVEVPAEPSATAPTPVKAEDTLKATADRLAQLEAEIADLAEAVTAAPARPASSTSAARHSAPEQREKTPPATSFPDEPVGSADEDSSDGETAEITIIGADGAPVSPTRTIAREAPRIFREGAFPEEEEAEVEIKGDGTASHRRRSVDRPGIGPGNTRHNGSRGPLGKWRIFRGSN